MSADRYAKAVKALNSDLLGHPATQRMLDGPVDGAHHAPATLSAWVASAPRRTQREASIKVTRDTVVVTLKQAGRTVATELSYYGAIGKPIDRVLDGAAAEAVKDAERNA